MYTINQLNNKYNLSTEDKCQMEKIYKTIAYSFSGPLNSEDFKNLEMEHYIDQRGSTQFFYLTAENGDIVSVTEIVPRKGNIKNSLNLLLTMVFTNPNYRKQGLIAKLINWVIKYYETGNIFTDNSLKISESIKNIQCKLYIDSIIPQNYRDNFKIHWSLYSIINDFYKQFGFIECNDINWLEIKANDINLKNIDFKINNKNEKLLKINDLKKYYFNDEYNFTEIIDENLLNCSFEESSHPGFIERIQTYIKYHENEIPNKEFLQNCGFLITNNDKNFETIIFLCPFFFINRIVVNRVFTSCENIEDFSIHWKRATQFIYKYAEIIWDSIDCLKNYDENEKIIMIADNDFISKNNLISKQDFINLVLSNDSNWKNQGTGIVLPMIRDWKNHKIENGKKPSMLANNGHWSFM